MKKILLIIIALSVSFCTTGESVKKIDPSKPYISIEFSFNTESYHSFIKKFYPQIAIWITSKNENPKTLYVTSKGAKNNWFGADERPSALPIWRQIQKQETDTSIDTISGATPSGTTYRVEANLPRGFNPKNPIEIHIEANISFDYNKAFPEKAPVGSKEFSGVNGQPSLLWKGTILPGKAKTTVTPEIIGHGNLLGKDGKLYRDLSKITTAKNIFTYIKIKYHKPGDLK